MFQLLHHLHPPPPHLHTFCATVSKYMSYILILPQCHMYIVCFIIWHHKLQNVMRVFLCKQILSDDHWNIVGFFLKDVILYWFNMRCGIVGIGWLCRCYGCMVSLHMEMIKIESEIEIEIYARRSDCFSQSKYRYVRGIYVSSF